MSQLTLRVPDEMAESLKAEAARRGLSMNGYAAAVLAAAIDPDLGETEMERLRGRLDRAGLLEHSANPTGRARPSPERVKAARSRAGQGRSLSDLVAEGRR